jgi:hypothetical protein
MKSGVWDADVNAHPHLVAGVQDEFESHGYKCFIGRNAMWAYVGYVQLPENHPDYKKSYDELNYGDDDDKNDCDEKDNETSSSSQLPTIDVHGGLTFASEGKFGFDCAHGGDIMIEFDSPWSTQSSFNSLDKYWMYAKVKEMIENLAQTFKERQEHFLKKVCKNQEETKE